MCAAKRNYFLAYRLIKQGSRIKISIAASERQPLFNPAFIITNWKDADRSDITLTLNGNIMENKKDYWKGWEIDTKGEWQMAIWLVLETHSKAEINIE